MLKVGFQVRISYAYLGEFPMPKLELLLARANLQEIETKQVNQVRPEYANKDIESRELMSNSMFTYWR